MKTDMNLQADVLAELEFEPSINAAHVGVTAEAGVVTLTGSVTTYAEKIAMVHAAERVLGVKAVADETQYKFASSYHRDDADIARVALNALKWNLLVPLDSVQVTVAQGWVTLEGNVQWEFQRTQAHDTVAAMVGVHGVTSNLTIKTSLPPQQVEASIKRAFERHAQEDLQRVKVNVSGNSVTLSGTLPSWAERDEAARAAWSAPGVAAVVNNIDIGLRGGWSAK